MFKDKPVSHTRPAVPPIRNRSHWLLAVLAVLLLFYFLHKPSQGLAIPGTTGHIIWSDYAYTQYATDEHYLCNSVMLFESLHRLGSKADRVLFYPRSWDTTVHSSKDRTSQLLVIARDTYKVKLHPIDFFTVKHDDTDTERTGQTWDASVNKLRAFELTQYKRVIQLDSDSTMFTHLDELFFLPSAPAAMPRAYWDLELDHALTNTRLTSMLIVLEPSALEAEKLWELAAGVGNETGTLNAGLNFDMEILNTRYRNNALVLPHRGYALLTGEFRRHGRHNHSDYLGTQEEWDPDAALKEAKVVHFSDWPLPKPWIMWPNSLMRDLRPDCEFDSGTSSEHGCRDREVWMGLYDNFRRRRKEICALLSVPAPDWPPKERPKKEDLLSNEKTLNPSVEQ